MCRSFATAVTRRFGADAERATRRLPQLLFSCYLPTELLALISVHQRLPFDQRRNFASLVDGLQSH